MSYGSDAQNVVPLDDSEGMDSGERVDLSALSLMGEANLKLA